MKPKNIQIVEKIANEMLLAERFMGDKNVEAFLIDDQVEHAVCMCVVNIGELVKNLDDEFRAMHRSIPWRELAGFRDIAAHRYQTLRMEDVYTTVHVDFPEIRSELMRLLEEAEADESMQESECNLGEGNRV